MYKVIVFIAAAVVVFSAYLVIKIFTELANEVKDKME